MGATRSGYRFIRMNPTGPPEGRQHLGKSMPCRREAFADRDWIWVKEHGKKIGRSFRKETETEYVKDPMFRRSTTPVRTASGPVLHPVRHEATAYRGRKKRRRYRDQKSVNP